MSKYLIFALIISFAAIGFFLISRGKVEAASQDTQPTIQPIDTGSEDMMGSDGVVRAETASIAEVSPTPLDITPPPLDKEIVTRQGDTKTFFF